MEITSIVNATSEICNYEASLVKCYDPGCIIFDIHYEDRNMIAEMKSIEEVNRAITMYWNIHKDDPVEGRKYLLGEIVAVNVVNSWKAAMIVNFKIRNGLHYYELVLLDTGHLVEVHRMDFRWLDDDVKVYHRFAFFGMMDLVPTGEDASSPSSWNISACSELQTMFDLATSITVDVMAKQKFCNSERIFGNIFITIGNHVIDLKQRLVKRNAAYESPDDFKSFHKLSYEDFCVKHQEMPDRKQKSEEVEYEEIDVEEITDENLDNHIMEHWRRGGADPLTQEERLRVRHKLSVAARISFARPQSLAETENDFALDKKLEANDIPHSTKGRKFLLSMFSSARRRSSDETSKDTSDTDCTDRVAEDMNQSRKSSASGHYASDEESNTSRCDVFSENYDPNSLYEQKVERETNLSETYPMDSHIHVFSEEVGKKFGALFK